MSYLVFDVESSYGKHAGRVSSRWCPEFGLCSIGWITGGRYADRYTVNYDHVVGERRGSRPGILPFPNLFGITLLVGHNIKFDLLWYWDHPEIISFLKRGGKIWDTMYAEYLLSGQFFNMHGQGKMGIGLKVCADRRGLKHQKLDMVAALWDKGVRTEDIEEAILLEYQKGDILTTEELFLAQVKQAREQGQVKQIQQRMEGLLATTAMEFNGMYVDQEVAAILQKELEDEIAELQSRLDQYIPELPAECPFNWSSWRNVSALLFGGEITYTGNVLSLKDGAPQYYQKKVRVPVLDENGDEVFYKSGKNKGEQKMKWETRLDYERGPKTKLDKLSVHIDGITKPHPSWKSSAEGYYSTGKEVMEVLKTRGLPLVDDLVRLSGAMKDLGTYYKRFNKGKWSGMLTNIQPDGMVHGELNHAITVTSRLSSSNPK